MQRNTSDVYYGLSRSSQYLLGKYSEKMQNFSRPTKYPVKSPPFAAFAFFVPLLLGQPLGTLFDLATHATHAA